MASKAKRTVAKLFWSGRDQAVRLPKEFRFDGDAVLIRRDGDRVILEPDRPVRGWPEDWFESFTGMPDDFARPPQCKHEKPRKK
jgi:antitoxin VapB